DIRQRRLDERRRCVRGFDLALGRRGRPTDKVQAAGAVLTAKQAPHRPGIAPALGLRAGADNLFRRPASSRSAAMRFLPWRSSPKRRGPRRSLTAQQPSLEQLEDRSVPTAGPLPIPGGLPGFNPGDIFEHLNLPGPADAPPPFGNEPSSITNFNGF